MYRIVKYSIVDKALWNSFVKNSKNGIFMFDRDFMEYHSDRFVDNSLMFYDEKDNLVALMPANIKDNVLYSHQGLTYGGFIINKDMKQHKMLKCFESLKTYMQEKNISQLVYKTIPHIYHKLPSEEDLYALYFNNAHLLKIEPSTTIFLASPCKMTKGRKAQVSRAKREGAVVQESNDFKAFIELENKVLKENHNVKAVHTGEELELLNSRFSDNIKLFVAKYNNEIIAGALLFIYDEVVHTQYLAANDKAREIGALDLIINELINKYKNSKKYFDFGISTEDNGQYLNEGLISQKESFGGRTTCNLVWELNGQHISTSYQLADVQSRNIKEGTNICQYGAVLPDANIGANATKFSEATVGENTIMTTRSIVAKDVEKDSMVGI